jgi:hypothetical protein
MEEVTVEQQDKEAAALKKQLQLLKKLNYNEEFILWRDQIVKPMIDALEVELSNPLELTEANLKAKLMHLNSLKHYFYRLFDSVEAELKLDK